MKERRKDALKLLGVSLPILGGGLYIFNPEGIANRFVEVLAIVALILGVFGAISGLIMFFTKNSLGMVETKPMAERVQEEEITAEEATLGILHGEDSNAEEPKLKMPS